MPCEPWKQIRLDRVNKKLSSLEHVLRSIYNDINNYITNPEERNDLIDSLIYGNEALEGATELLGDIKNDIFSIIEQIDEEQTPHLDIPDKI
jgi:hypothetical protein